MPRKGHYGHYLINDMIARHSVSRRKETNCIQSHFYKECEQCERDNKNILRHTKSSESFITKVCFGRAPCMSGFDILLFTKRREAKTLK